MLKTCEYLSGNQIRERAKQALQGFSYFYSHASIKKLIADAATNPDRVLGKQLREQVKEFGKKSCNDRPPVVEDRAPYIELDRVLQEKNSHLSDYARHMKIAKRF